MEKVTLEWFSFGEKKPKEGSVIFVRGQLGGKNIDNHEYYTFIVENGKLCSVTTGKSIYANNDRFKDYLFTHWAYPPTPTIRRKQEYIFGPFDKVLVRQGEDEVWRCTLFSHWFIGDNGETLYVGMGLGAYSECIPYEGNEHLLGTNLPHKIA